MAIYAHVGAWCGASVPTLNCLPVVHDAFAGELFVARYCFAGLCCGVRADDLQNCPCSLLL